MTGCLQSALPMARSNSLILQTMPLITKKPWESIFTFFEAGSTQITDGTQPEWTEDDVVAEFDFTNTNGFASAAEVKEALSKAGYVLDPSVYLGAAGGAALLLAKSRKRSK